jgi:hypothetical protein
MLHLQQLALLCLLTKWQPSVCSDSKSVLLCCLAMMPRSVGLTLCLVACCCSCRSTLSAMLRW